MTSAHCLGFPRIGVHRENKQVVEQYWRGECTQAHLEAIGQQLRKKHWQLQRERGLDFVAVGDFSWYDHVLDMSAMLGVVPKRFDHSEGDVDLDTIFRMARGRAPTGQDAPACEMTKWFDTNYHYIVPELTADQTFALSTRTLFQHIREARALGYQPKPVILGPLSYLYLAKTKDGHFDKLLLLDKLLHVYGEIFSLLKEENIEWLQIDEPILTLDLADDWKSAFEKAYNQLHFSGLKILLATYFGGLEDNTSLACELPVAGIHIDCVRAPKQLDYVLDRLPAYKILSVGIVNGRNIWSADLEKCIDDLQEAHQRIGDRLWVGTSCSLLHCPVDLDEERHLDAELKSWLAFAAQKIKEVALINTGLKEGKSSIAKDISASNLAQKSRAQSPRIHNGQVKARMASDEVNKATRHSAYAERRKAQEKLLNLPLFPTTTIGSFPQTAEIRKTRSAYKKQEISWADYEAKMQEEIKSVIQKQEAMGLDVLVHGEPERNDMVEYFGELLHGFAFTDNGWVQSYGSRCVKPPVIYGDVSRAKPMTVKWSQFAQAHTEKWMKGMLTGPVTILCWSFVRDDQPRSQTAFQIALALRDEVVDLEKAGIRIIQIDEPAFREGLPLRRSAWNEYLQWAAQAFRVTASGVEDATQIHTHMCYAEFNDIIQAIADLDADVITIESSRSQMELLEAFEHFEYPNEIGPGVYDIHSPLVPEQDTMVALLEKAMKSIPAERLWVNPDCGLKTRDWPEVEAALRHMVKAAEVMREKKPVTKTVAEVI